MADQASSRSTALPRRLTWGLLRVLAFVLYAFLVLRIFTPYLISAHDDLALALAVLLFATLPILFIWWVWGLLRSFRGIQVAERSLRSISDQTPESRIR